MNDAPADSPAIGFARPEPQDESWSRSRWLTIIAFIFAAHIGLIFIFGAHKPIVPRIATNVPQLQLAENSGELIALNDPTLFALPNAKDFVSAAWLKMPDKKPQPSFRWTEPPRWLPLVGENLGLAFIQFMQTNYFLGYELRFKPSPELSAPMLPIEPALAQTSTLQIEGELAQRRLLNDITLPSLPYNDVIAPSTVQILVDAAGNVISAVLLPPENLSETTGHYDIADQRALEIARTAHFTPSSQLTFGRLIFNWHTVPAAVTNSP